MSHDKELLEQIAKKLEDRHSDSEHNFEYWVVKGPVTIDNMEVFETRKDELLDSWEDVE